MLDKLAADYSDLSVLSDANPVLHPSHDSNHDSRLGAAQPSCLLLRPVVCEGQLRQQAAHVGGWNVDGIALGSSEGSWIKLCG